jgi:iron complex transport system ATP-binding protein
MTTLAAEGLVVELGGRPVLHGPSGRFDTGWTVVVGPNGAGKSTLLRALAGLLPLRAGRVALDERPLASFTAAERGRRIAWLAQAGDVSGELTARETVHLGRLPHLGLFGAPGRADEAIVDRAIERCECGTWQHRRLRSLSGGERQRVLLARALATEAPVLLLDEPGTHLDPPHQVALARLCRELGRTHTVVTVQHDLALALHADRVLLLRDGRIGAFAVHDDPVLHAALVAAFGGAIRIVPGTAPGERALVLPRL